MVARSVHLLVALASAGVLLAACTSEPATVIDLDAPTTTATASSGSSDGSTVTAPPLPDEVDPDDPNAESQQMVIDAARQQCLDDPELDEGVVRIVLEATGEVASEYRVDCDEVRSESD